VSGSRAKRTTATLEKEQARLIEGVFSTKQGVVRVCNIYLPNGNPVNGGGVGDGSEASNGDKKKSDKFNYKLSWMNRLNEFVKERLTYEEPFILMGDFNIIPASIDCHDPKNWWGDALYRPESQEIFRTLSNMGMTDALRAVSDEPNYSFWDFQAGAWRKNNGIRIDFLMLSPQAADKLSYVKTHKETRSLERPSDHVPVEGGFSFHQT
jgi:exodeoxyribonuclease-3